MLTKENGFTLPFLCKFRDASKYAFAFISLLIILLVIYSNSFQGTWQFDDQPNIVENSNLFLKTFNWHDITKSFYGVNGKSISRPFSYFSFALNYYLSGLNVFGFHVVNFIIHYLSSVFLFLFIYSTLKLPTVRERYIPSSYSYNIALLATVFWATSPLQVNAVIYIVQRMASMAGLFYIMAMYFYLKGRMSDRPWKYLVYGGLCVLSAALGFATKENAFMLPFSIWLYDLLIIQGATRENVLKNLKFLAPVIIIAAAVSLWYIDISSILSGASYANRPFTLTERLLTEPRIIIFYITLLFYPVSSRLTLLHDIELSKSFLTPWSTLPAIAVIVMLLVLAIYISRKRPLISFCIFFFFLNHIIESSFLPLELVFEHRNYVPSMFFFVPVVIGMLHVIDYFSYKKVVQFMIVAVVTFLLAAQGHTVFVRNALFADPILLWADNVKKAPKLSRPHGNLGSYFSRSGDWISSMHQYELALALKNYINFTNEPEFYHANLSMGYLNSGQEDSAIQECEKFLKIGKGRINANTANVMATALVMTGKVNESYALIRKALILEPENENYLSNLAFIFLKMGKLEKSIEVARKTLLMKPDFDKPLAILGEAYLLKRNYRLAIYFWQQYQVLHPEDVTTICALIELYEKTKQQDLLITSVYKLLYISSDKGLETYLSEITLHPFRYAHTVNQELMYEIIRKTIRKIGSSFSIDPSIVIPKRRGNLLIPSS